MSVLSRKEFHDEKAAVAFVEAHVWPHGPVCPRCGSLDRVNKLKGKSTRIGTYKCYECRKPFTVKIGTIFEDSKVPMHLWLQAMYLMCASKKGISSNQLHRTLGVTLKTAWFMGHRIREAMRTGNLDPFGVNGGAVEVDETFIGNDRTVKPKGEKRGRGYAHKFKVLSLVDRTTGKARSMVVNDLRAKTLTPILQENISREANIMTDEAGQYTHLRKHFAGHDVVHHNRGEYGRGETYTNTVEGFFSIFKRGMKGVYQHCAKRHLHRYLAEFDYRYNERGIDDPERFAILLPGVVGKRLTYRDSFCV